MRSQFPVRVLAMASLVVWPASLARRGPAGPDVDPDMTTTTQAIGEMKCASIAFTPVNQEASGDVVRLFVSKEPTAARSEPTRSSST